MSEYIENLQRSIAEHQRIIEAGRPEAPEAQDIINRFQAEIARVQGSGGGDQIASGTGYGRRNDITWV